jgi:hypothetical protein
LLLFFIALPRPIGFFLPSPFLPAPSTTVKLIPTLAKTNGNADKIAKYGYILVKDCKFI